MRSVTPKMITTNPLIMTNLSKEIHVNRLLCTSSGKHNNNFDNNNDNNNNINNSNTRGYQQQQQPSINNKNIEMEEIKIPMPWGHIAGKWWGPKTIRPIVALHGWQDNAGTFDTLIPLLPKHLSYLAIDLPGHGLSSRVPDGMYYNAFDCLHIINLLCKIYEWDKISLMGHSMSSILSFLYSTCFPEQCDLVIGLDALKPHIRKPKQIVDTLTKRTRNFLLADMRNRENSEPPCYTYDELIEKLKAATLHSITTEAAPYLLERAVKNSAIYPDKYYFSRDSRLKCFNYATVSQDVCLEMAGRLTMPYLFIKATNSPYYEDKKYFNETIDIMKNNSKFELHYVDGTHHCHLTHPTLVNGIISDFINKYRPFEYMTIRFIRAYEYFKNTYFRYI